MQIRCDITMQMTLCQFISSNLFYFGKNCTYFTHYSLFFVGFQCTNVSVSKLFFLCIKLFINCISKISQYFVHLPYHQHLLETFALFPPFNSSFPRDPTLMTCYSNCAFSVTALELKATHRPTYERHLHWILLNKGIKGQQRVLKLAQFKTESLLFYSHS